MAVVGGENFGMDNDNLTEIAANVSTVVDLVLAGLGIKKACPQVASRVLLISLTRMARIIMFASTSELLQQYIQIPIISLTLYFSVP